MHLPAQARKHELSIRMPSDEPIGGGLQDPTLTGHFYTMELTL
jgi:hypothetical protein